MNTDSLNKVHNVTYFVYLKYEPISLYMGNHQSLYTPYSDTPLQYNCTYTSEINQQALYVSIYIQLNPLLLKLREGVVNLTYT